MVKRKALNVINEEISDGNEFSASANSHNDSANETDTTLAMHEKRKRLTQTFELSQIADQDMTPGSYSDETLNVNS